MLTFALRKKRTPSIASKRHAPTVSPMSHSLHLQQAKIRHILHSPTLQPKLKIGQPDDKYEREADRVADEVMRMPEPRLQRQVEPEEEEEETLQAKPLVSQITPLVQVQRQEEPEEEETFQTKPLAQQITPLIQRQVEPEEEEEEEEPIQAKSVDGIQVQRQENEVEEERPEEEEEEPLVQRKGHSGKAPTATLGLEDAINHTRSQGQPLPGYLRAFFELRFGHNFGQVRVHSNDQAAQAAGSISAQAFTRGRDIYFGAGHYQPNTTSGRTLIAHELTHVVQQDPAYVAPRIGLPRSYQHLRPPTRSVAVHAGTRTNAKLYRQIVTPRKTLVPRSSGWTVCYPDPRLGQSVCRPTKLRVCLWAYNRSRRRHYILCSPPISSLSQSKLILLIDIVSRQLSKYNVSSTVTNILETSRDLLQKEYLRRQGIGRWNNKTWDWATLKAIETIGPKLISVMPSDIGDFCPKYNQLGDFLRKTFWVYFLSCMAQWESGFKPNLKYGEKFKFRGKHVISRGLLQISFNSAKQKRYGCAEIKTSNDLHDPVKNLRCGIRILNYWIGKDRRIGGAKPWKGGGRYWAVLRKRKTSSALAAIKKWTKRLPFCK